MGKDINNYKLGNTTEEFEELFGNVPIKDIDKIKKYIFQNYIPISVIQNKIDELEPQVHLLQPNAKPCELMREFKVEGALNVLQELLEERNK